MILVVEAAQHRFSGDMVAITDPMAAGRWRKAIALSGGFVRCAY
jgi:predicted secreted protein